MIAFVLLILIEVPLLVWFLRPDPKQVAVDWLLVVLKQVVPLAAAAQQAEDRKWDPPPGTWVDGFGQERKLADLSNDHLLNVRNFLLRAVGEDREAQEAWEDEDCYDEMTRMQVKVDIAVAKARLDRIERREKKLGEVEAEVSKRHLKRKRSYR